MTKELLQQALDALDKSIIFANSQGIGGWQPTVMACHEAKDAIKQALAQQERDALRADAARQEAKIKKLVEALELIATAENSALDLAHSKGIARAALAQGDKT